MRYDLFLIDLDDTLLDFRESERLSFSAMLEGLGATRSVGDIFGHYRQVNDALWEQFERGLKTKEHLRIERFRATFAAHGLDLDAEKASALYLEALPRTVALMPHAVELCQWMSERGEIGIVTNGMHEVQTQRIANSALAPYISFVSVSEICGYAKPDVRFFEHSSRMAKRFDKASSLVIGDRIGADIQGAVNFGVDSCWFNPSGLTRPDHLVPTFEVAHLSEISVKLAA